MDALLSLPLLSAVLLPTYMSYSTQLNLLFFYLTWSSLILSYSSLKVEFIGTLFIRLVFYLIPSYAFLLFDAAIPSIAVNIKQHGETAIATNREHRKGQWWRVASLSTFNVVLGIAIQIGVEFLFINVLHIRSALKITTTLPLPWGIAKDIAKGFLFREVSSYLIHRYVLHGDRSPLQSLHESHYHSLAAPYSLVAHYDHPLPYLLRVFLPTYLPALIFRFHLLTFHAFLALVSLEELWVYSGYNVLPRGFMLSGLARRQESHMLSGGNGNFGAYGLLDFMTGTSIGRDVVEDMRAEAERKDLPGKAKRGYKQIRDRSEKQRNRK